MPGRLVADVVAGQVEVAVAVEVGGGEAVGVAVLVGDQVLGEGGGSFAAACQRRRAHGRGSQAKLKAEASTGTTLASGTLASLVRWRQRHQAAAAAVCSHAEQLPQRPAAVHQRHRPALPVRDEAVRVDAQGVVDRAGQVLGADRAARPGRRRPCRSGRRRLPPRMPAPASTRREAVAPVVAAPLRRVRLAACGPSRRRRRPASRRAGRGRSRSSSSAESVWSRPGSRCCSTSSLCDVAVPAVAVRRVPQHGDEAGAGLDHAPAHQQSTGRTGAGRSGRAAGPARGGCRAPCAHLVRGDQVAAPAARMRSWVARPAGRAARRCGVELLQQAAAAVEAVERQRRVGASGPAMRKSSSSSVQARK